MKGMYKSYVLVVYWEAREVDDSKWVVGKVRQRLADEVEKKKLVWERKLLLGTW
jgi:hypothetical protein